LIGAIIGGIVGTFVKSSVPEDVAPYYAEGIRRGGTLIVIQTYDTLRASDIMNRYGSVNIHERSTLWRQAGWKGFDAESVEGEDTARSSEMSTAITSDTTTTRVTHMTHSESPVTVSPVHQVAEAEPQIDEKPVEPSLVITAPATEMGTPVTSVSDERGIEPILPMVEAEPDIEDDEVQLIEDIEL
jgi:hypothetical protein